MSTIPERLLRWVVRFAPETRREWAEAMAAELEYVRGNWSRWQWSLGCTWTVVLESISGGVRGSLNSSGKEEAAMRRLTFCGALISIAIFFGLLLSPMFRQALRVGEGSLTSRETLSQSRLRALVQEARQRNDADLLAWTALRLENSDRIAIAKEAVALDPRLTWIFYPVCEFQSAEGEAACPAMIQTLKQWAPGNAVPWLMEATAARSRFVSPLKDEPPKEAAWKAAMDRAFASPEYDSYRKQRIDLERRVYRAGKIDSPMLMLYGLYSHPFPDVADIQWQAKQLRTSDPGKVAAFSAVMQRGSQSDIELLVASGLTRDGHVEEPLRRAVARGVHWGAFAMVNAAVVQYSMAALIFGILLVIGALCARLTRVTKSAAAEFCGVLGAAIVGASSVAIYIAYLPYSQVLEAFLGAPENRVDEGSLAIFGSLSQMSFWHGQREEFMVYLWSAVLIASVVVLAFMGTRMVTKRVKVT